MYLAFMMGYILNAGIRPPAKQDQTVIPVAIIGLDEKTSWLEGAKACLVPLRAIQSPRRYYILVISPPGKKFTPTENASSTLNLLGGSKGGIQPIDITTRDFGINDDQVAVKLFDYPGLGVTYKETDKLTLSPAN